MHKARNASGDLAIYDGRERIATVIDDDTGCTLCDARGNVLGRYGSRGEAMRALRGLVPPIREGDGQ